MYPVYNITELDNLLVAIEKINDEIEYLKMYELDNVKSKRLVTLYIMEQKYKKILRASCEFLYLNDL